MPQCLAININISYAEAQSSAELSHYTYIYVNIDIDIYILRVFLSMHIYICICIARRLTFARNPRNSMRDSNLLCCFRACFSHTASMQNIDITCVSWHFCAYLRRCQNHLLKRILKISSVICSVLSR